MDDRELYQLIVGMSDIRAAYETADYAATVLKGDIRTQIWFPLLEAVVISYARPFTANRPYGRLPARWATFNDPVQQTLHDELIDIRNRATAHSDAAVRQILIIPPGALLPLSSKEVARRSNFAISYDRLLPSRFVEIERHCAELVARMQKEVSAEMHKFDSRPSFAFDLLTGERVDDPEANVTDVSPGE